MGIEPGMLADLLHSTVTYLGIFYFQCTTSGINVGSIQRVLGSLGFVQCVKLDHCLDAILLEDDDPHNFTGGLAD